MKLNEAIRLSGMGGGGATQSFIDDYIESTEAHPFNGRARIYEGSASIELSPMSNKIHLSDIQTLNAGGGAGTRAMRFLTSLADKHRVQIELSAKPYSSNQSHITQLEDLVRWYMRLGFRITDDLTDSPDDLEGIDYVDMTYFPSSGGSLRESTILMESFKDAERIFEKVFMMIKDRFFRGREEDVRTMAWVVTKRFKQVSHQMPSDMKDISMWIGRANKIDSQEDAIQFYFDIKDLIAEAEDRTPDYEVVGDEGRIRITHLKNFAAVKKLCGRMRICIRSNKEDFESYSSSGALFLIETRGRKYVYEYSRFSEEGTIWNEANEEMEWEEFFDEIDAFFVPGYQEGYYEETVEDALENFRFMFRLYKRGGL